MSDYLILLVKEILGYYPDGVSKVRLAKLIYLIHKGLTQKKLVDREELAFIRMPLGPVPFGFKELNQLQGLTIEVQSVGLSYNKQNYKYGGESKSKFNPYIVDLLKKLNNIPTSELVNYTHGEPSWKNHINGDEYFIESEDLKRTLPVRNVTVVTPDIDDQKLQALLINGMIDDIVDESTALEYPQADK